MEEGPLLFGFCKEAAGSPGGREGQGEGVTCQAEPWNVAKSCKTTLH